MKNDISEFMKSPTINLLSLIVKKMLEKSGDLTTAPIKGVIKSLTIASTILLKAAPTATPTAKVIMLSLNINSLNPFIIFFYYIPILSLNRITSTFSSLLFADIN